MSCVYCLALQWVSSEMIFLIENSSQYYILSAVQCAVLPVMSSISGLLTKSYQCSSKKSTKYVYLIKAV